MSKIISSYSRFVTQRIWLDLKRTSYNTVASYFMSTIGKPAVGNMSNPFFDNGVINDPDLETCAEMDQNDL